MEIRKVKTICGEDGFAFDWVFWTKEVEAKCDEFLANGYIVNSSSNGDVKTFLFTKDNRLTNA